MPSISFFADGRDANFLLERLNADPEIAFIVPDGPVDPAAALANGLRLPWRDGSEIILPVLGMAPEGPRQRWKAVRTVEELKDGAHSLWHVPAGPLPLLVDDGSEQPIPDPWAGWTEQRPGADPGKPYFGPGHHAEIRLGLWNRHRPYSTEEKASLPLLNSHWIGEKDLLVASDFQWIGGHYGPPPPQTRRRWNRLKAWFERSTIRLADGRVAFWAFPSAFQKLKAGMSYYSRGFDLDESIRTAEINIHSPELRDLIAPHPITCDARWLTWNGGIIPKMAQAIYEEKAFGHLPILADALEEAGCNDAELLSHLRGPGPHAKGCWAIDAILGRS